MAGLIFDTVKSYYNETCEYICQCHLPIKKIVNTEQGDAQMHKAIVFVFKE